MRFGADVRVVAGAAATLEWREFDQDGEPTNTTGSAPTVTVTRLDGTTVSTGTATDATTHWTYALTGAQTGAQPDELTASWVVGGVTHTTTASVVGGQYCSLARARDNDTWFSGTNAPSNDRLLLARRVAEAEVEWVTERSFVARADRVSVESPGRWTLILPDWDLRSVRYVAHVDTGGTETEYTGAVRVDDAGLLYRVDGSSWPCTGTVVVEYEYGHRGVPGDLVEMFVRRWKWWASQASAKTFSRTETWSAGEGGGTIRFAATTARKTGDADVDAAYERWTQHRYGLT